MVIGTLGALICCSIILYTQVSLSILPWVLVVFGILNSVQVIVFPVAKEISASANTATAIAMINMICMLSGILQTIVGRLLEYTHQVLEKKNISQVGFTLIDYHVAYLTLPFFLSIALILLFCMNESYGMDQA